MTLPPFVNFIKKKQGFWYGMASLTFQFFTVRAATGNFKGLCPLSVTIFNQDKDLSPRQMLRSQLRLQVTKEKLRI